MAGWFAWLFTFFFQVLPSLLYWVITFCTFTLPTWLFTLFSMSLTFTMNFTTLYGPTAPALLPPHCMDSADHTG